ncbi:hypothetical protein RFI_03270 [Reticulomyxa filosa]|uniref:MYND-type domain-containing protein n=1 Tax=Reticulomyxa filosa TaxID=46433 RepID=X6P873_RETFI|nr:hypothetical protein RFI_03270 [Reticulomyxa filosa]|eukprot:ETO33832.1 hypothetical protein RFI_03270 [Reticulomyxa filosa]
MGLVSLIENHPFIRRKEKKHENTKLTITEKFENNQWIEYDASNVARMSKIEANLWLCVYNLFMDKEVRKRYEINEFRQNHLLKLRKFLSPMTLDQLPVLVDMKRSLEELALLSTLPLIKSSFDCIEVLPHLRQKLLASDFASIAKKQMQEIFSKIDTAAKQKELESWARTYNIDILEKLSLLNSNPTCACCGKNAEKRCSRCKLEWYCSRACQVSSWKTHKNVCTNLAPTTGQDKTVVVSESNTTRNIATNNSGGQTSKVIACEKRAEYFEDTNFIGRNCFFFLEYSKKTSFKKTV